MSATTTLQAFQEILDFEFPDLTVLTTTPSVPFEYTGPTLILSERSLKWKRRFTGLRGQDGNDPNIYGFVYIQGTLQETNLDIESATQILRDNLEHFIAIFDKTNYANLNGNVVRAGDTIIVNFDSQGTFIEYLGGLYIGCYGTIDVWEDYRFNTY